jgi:hypothetical protein
MSADPMRLVRFICVANAHAAGRSESSLTIHDGVWAFCPMGGDQRGHEWRPSDGLPFTEALRFTPRPYASAPLDVEPAPLPRPGPQPSARGKARPR